MNDILFGLGIESWKPVLAMLLLPPVPLLVLVLVGARLMFRRRLLAWLLVLLGVAGIWLLSTGVVARGLLNGLLQAPPALTETNIGELKRAPRTAIVVLGAGRRLLAPEYGVSTLKPRGVERLRYGIWLARETGLPLAFSGGIGHRSDPGPNEAEIAARIAEREFRHPLRWTEDQSRDTKESALRTVALLLPQGIEQIVLVTDDFHMPRALHNFELAAQGRKLKLVAAPLGLPPGGPWRAADWLPDPHAALASWLVLHEWLGRLGGA